MSKVEAFIGGLIGAVLISVVTFSSMGYGTEPRVDRDPQAWDGSAKYYYDGQLTSEANFKSGKLEGVAKWYDMSGRLEKEGVYKDGKREGTFKYYADGRLEREVVFKDGKMDGVGREYCKNGKLKYETIYKDGEPGETKFYNNEAKEDQHF